jgi:hypothetical protein
MGASVKVMLSYDYCHFEVSKSSDADLSNEEIDAMRKDCMRLADKAIEQYKIAKKQQSLRSARGEERENMEREVAMIEKKPESDRTPRELAKVKAYKDRNWEEYISAKYDYQDDWRDEEASDNKEGWEPW